MMPIYVEQATNLGTVQFKLCLFLPGKEYTPQGLTIDHKGYMRILTDVKTIVQILFQEFKYTTGY